MKIESSDDDDEDDEPLIKMIKKPPSDEQLKTAVKDLLKNANLEEVTMKQICQQVTSYNSTLKRIKYVYSRIFNVLSHSGAHLFGWCCGFVIPMRS